VAASLAVWFMLFVSQGIFGGKVTGMPVVEVPAEVWQNGRTLDIITAACGLWAGAISMTLLSWIWGTWSIERRET